MLTWFKFGTNSKFRNSRLTKAYWGEQNEQDDFECESLQIKIELKKIASDMKRGCTKCVGG
jgi:hypothetical protein